MTVPLLIHIFHLSCLTSLLSLHALCSWLYVLVKMVGFYFSKGQYTRRINNLLQQTFLLYSQRFIEFHQFLGMSFVCICKLFCLFVLNLLLNTS